MRGQALVEFALVLPLLLMLMLGGVAVGLVMVDRYNLVHAATEGAMAGAAAGGDCTIALDTARAVLGRPVASEDCSDDGVTLAVTLSDEVAFPVPFVRDSWPVTVTERSALP